MYKEGEYIVYGLNGVCLIESITTLDMKDVRSNEKLTSS